MITDDIAKLLIGYGKKSIESWTDRLTHKIFPIVLLFISAAMFGQKVFGEPIQCAFPNDIPGAATKYALEICWANNTYYVPVGKVVNPEEAKNEIKYYKWVPLFLILQALLCHAPVIMWRSIQKMFGTVKLNWTHLRSSSFIGMYVAFKLIAIGCLAVQFVIVNGFYGENPMFPINTMCDFTLRQMANFQKYTVQCALGTNLYNDALSKIMKYVLLTMLALSCLDVFFFGLRLIRGPRSQGVVGMDRRRYGLFVLLKMNNRYDAIATTLKRIKQEKEEEMAEIVVHKMRDDGEYTSIYADRTAEEESYLTPTSSASGHFVP